LKLKDHQEDFRQSEDCLTINVIRPSGFSGTYLPVAVYIYGGGSHGGGSSDSRYNLSFIVSHATKSGMPFIAVSLNYRSGILGFINGMEVAGTRNQNIGLFDQRLALQWVQENIAMFGGDRTKVTLWGGSSGADSVGLHLVASGGQNHGLFRAAILQSGGPITRTGFREAPAQKMLDAFLRMTGCNGTTDSLGCLRKLPFEQLNSIYQKNRAVMEVMSLPAMDGNLIQGFGSRLVKEGRIIQVPILAGTVSGEGSTLIPNNTKDMESLGAYLEGQSHQESCLFPLTGHHTRSTRTAPSSGFQTTGALLVAGAA
jgi:carboxylesterase type B